MPMGGKMQCSCGYIQEDGKIKDRKKKTDEVVVIDKEQPQILPKIKYDCKNCNNTEAFFWTLQTRGGDEPETRFFKCTKCSSVFREY